MHRLSAALLMGLASLPALADETYQNPVDGKAYAAPAWNSYAPEHHQPQDNGKVTLADVRLLSSQDAFQASIDMNALAGFIRAVQAKARDTFAGSTQSSEILLQFDCTQTSQKVRIAFQGQPETALLQKLYDAVTHMAPLRVKAEPVSFQIRLRVRA